MPSTRWHLKRNCSLTPRQSLMAWLLPVAALAAVMLFAAWQGWWWVVFFALVDIAGLTASLWLYTRHAMDGDTLLLDGEGMLHIEQQQGSWHCHTAWHASMVRLESEDGEPIVLWAGRERLQVGRQAAPHLRQLTVRELRHALRLDAAATRPTPAAMHPRPGS